MKVFLLLILSHLSTVLAGGYQGCLERVLLFNAYEIDGLNDESEQTIGFKCAKPDTTANTCDTWNACKAKKNSGRTRCNFDELVVFLGKTPNPNNWAVYDSDGKLDTEETAKQCYTKFTTAQGKNPKVPNFPPYVAMKDAWEFNDYTKRLGDTVNKTYKSKANAENKHLWETFDSTTGSVSVSRAGDHGPYLIEKAQETLGSKMDIKIQNLGSNPSTGEVWETVDWKETAKQAKANGVADVDKEIQGFLKSFYDGTDKKSKDHRVVIQTYKRVTDRSRSCR